MIECNIYDLILRLKYIQVSALEFASNIYKKLLLFFLKNCPGTGTNFKCPAAHLKCHITCNSAGASVEKPAIF